MFPFLVFFLIPLFSLPFDFYWFRYWICVNLFRINGKFLIFQPLLPQRPTLISFLKFRVAVDVACVLPIVLNLRWHVASRWIQIRFIASSIVSQIYIIFIAINGVELYSSAFCNWNLIGKTEADSRERGWFLALMMAVSRSPYIYYIIKNIKSSCSFR